MVQEDVNQLKKIEGKVRGVGMETDANYVRKKIGEKEVMKLQQATKELGWEIDYENIKTMNWYPVGMRALSLLAAKRAFGWDEETIKDMGNCAPKYSFVASTMIKYFFSIEKVFHESAKYWEKHYTVGKLEPFQIDEEKKFAILHLKDFKVHPIFCSYYMGYFLRICQFVVKSEKITIEELECPFKQGNYHKFLIKWL